MHVIDAAYSNLEHQSEKTAMPINTINVNSVSDRTGTAGDDHFFLSAISTGFPDATLDGAGGTNILDAQNVFVGYNTMFFTDEIVNGQNGFSFGDFLAVGFQEIIGNKTKNNWFLLQQLDHVVTVRGGSGDDWFATSFGAQGARTPDRMYGYAGDDYFNVRPMDRAYGGAGNDTFDLSGSSESLSGSKVSGGSGVDTLDLGFGWTVNLTRGFADSPYSGTTDRYRITSIENVIVSAWRSYDTRVVGSAEDNSFSVDPQFNDGSVGVYFNGLDGNDSLSGSMGDDTLLGGNGDDTLLGDAGNDRLNAGNDNDSLGGGSGRDTLIGGRGDDILNGDGGKDQVFGGNGRDTLNGGRGDDTLSGGQGNDRFVFAPNFGNDVITDFSARNGEVIDLSAITEITDFDDLVTNHLSNNAGFAQINVGNNSILLEGVAFSDVGIGLDYSANDFVFQ